jgi:O-antigen/teichoic acid export membrane protein
MTSRLRLGWSAVSANIVHISNTAYFILTRFAAVAAFIVAAPFFIERASDAQYGIATIGFSLLGLNSLLDVAFGYVAVQMIGRKIARGSEINQQALSGLLSIYIYFASALAAISVTAVLLTTRDDLERIFFSSLSLLFPALAISGVAAAVFQARNMLKPVNLSRFSFEIGKVAALVLSALISRNVLWIGPILFLFAYARAIADLAYLRHSAGIVVRPVRPMRAFRYWRLARHGSASFLIVLLTLIVTIGDKIAIKNVFDSQSVAYYSIAYDINTKAYLFVYGINATAFAVILKRSARRISTVPAIVTSIIAVCVIALFFYLPLAFFASDILRHWVSGPFALKAAPLVQIMAAASIFYLFGNIFENALLAMARARDVLKIYGGAVAAYIVSIPILTSMFALEGFMVSYLLLCFLLFVGFAYRYHALSQNLPVGGIRI